MYHNLHCTLVAGKLKSSGSLGRSSAVHSVTQLVVGNWTETKVDRDHCVLSLLKITLSKCSVIGLLIALYIIKFCSVHCTLSSKITLSLCDISYVYRICTGIISVVVVTSKRKDYSRILHSGDNFVKSSNVVIILWNYWRQFQDRNTQDSKVVFQNFLILISISLYALSRPE